MKRAPPLTRRLASLCLLVPGVNGVALAQPAPLPDTLTFRASYALLHDSNLFRLPEDADARATLGRDSLDEQIAITTVGLKLDKRFSLQRVQLDVSLVDYRYANFSSLDFTARNYSAAWNWALTPRLRGNLIAQRQQSLSSYADVQGFSRQNQSTRTQERFDFLYELDGAWRLLGGVARASQTNLSQLEEQDNTSTRSVDLGVRHDFASGSHLGYRLRSARGEYLWRDSTAPPGPGQAMAGTTFEQMSHELRLHWAWSAKTTADLSATFLDRQHPGRPERDFSGLSALASVNWKATGKTTWVATFSSDIASYQTASSNYVQTDRLSVGPVWQASAKTSVRLHHALAQRSFRGNPDGQADTPRRDLTHETSVSVDWAARRNVLVSASLARATRRSNTPGLDFSSNRAQISAQISF